MFSAQIGSPHERFHVSSRSVMKSPISRRSEPLFPDFPAAATPSAWNDNYSSHSTPANSTNSLHLTNSPQSARSFSSTVRIQNFTNVCRWDNDNQLHSIEYFIKKYGGSKQLPPSEWCDAQKDMRTDDSNGEIYDIFEFISY